MEQVIFRFYAELNDMLPPERRTAAFPHAVFLPASVKDVIESFGVPHKEVGLMLVNSEPVEFTRLVRNFSDVCAAFLRSSGMLSGRCFTQIKTACGSSRVTGTRLKASPVYAMD